MMNAKKAIPTAALYAGRIAFFVLFFHYGALGNG
jgi:hypothetical protein